MRFDWYAATIPAGPDELLGAVLGSHKWGEIVETRGMHGYDRGAIVKREGEPFVRALWGGQNGQHVHAWASGDDAPWFADLVRTEWPAHRVTRVDPCEDYTDPAAWDLLTGIFIEVADKHRVRVEHRGDFHREEHGRTLYGGAPSSVFRTRIYEKGIQVGGDPHWVRFEAQIRPKGDARELVATAQPGALLGASSWGKALGERLGIPELERIKVGTVYRRTDDDRAYGALLKQWGPLLSRLSIRVGGWSELGVQIGTDLADLEQRSSAARSA
jgi:hypothetical protein